MNQKEIAKDFFNQASLRFKTAKNVLEEGAFAYCIRQSQEAVELALKSALKLVGIDFPKWHDIGEFLVNARSKFPKEFGEKVSELAKISETLKDLREPSMYGDETQEMGPSSLFNRSDAEEIIKETNFTLQSVSLLFKAFEKNKNKVE